MSYIILQIIFRANFLVFGLNPIWFHITNILLHCIATMLFLRLCLNVAKLRGPFASFAALMFAVHPIHSEAVSVPKKQSNFFLRLNVLDNKILFTQVTGIVGRADVLACVFFLISILAYHEYVDPHKASRLNLNFCVNFFPTMQSRK